MYILFQEVNAPRDTGRGGIAGSIRYIIVNSELDRANKISFNNIEWFKMTIEEKKLKSRWSLMESLFMI